MSDVYQFVRYFNSCSYSCLYDYVKYLYDEMQRSIQKNYCTEIHRKLYVLYKMIRFVMISIHFPF